MSEEVAPATPESASPETPSNAAAETTDFRAYVKWRQTGDPPAEPEPTPPAAAAEETPPPAKTEPQSGAEETQQQTEEGEEGAEEDAEQGSVRRSGSRQRKIDKLTREVNDLKAQIAAAAAQQPKPAEPKPKPAEPPGKPRLEKYETLEAYQEALTEWYYDQREAKRKAEAEAEAAKAAQEKLQSEWDSRQRAARKAHRDYDDVIESIAAPDGPGVPAARQAMLEDEAGAEILYHLATHPDELKRIAALQPVAAVREIGRLSAILNPPSNAAANGKPFSVAPKPPPPVTRPGRPISDSIHDPAVQKDFRRWAKARTQQ